MMKIFKYLYYMMLGVLIGCILMSITGCKEEVKRDPHFVVKAQEPVNTEPDVIEDPDIIEDKLICGRWEEEFVDIETGERAYAVLIFNDYDKNYSVEGYISFGFNDEYLVFVGNYSFDYVFEDLKIYNVVLSQFTLELEKTYGNIYMDPTTEGSGGVDYCKINGDMMTMKYRDDTYHIFKKAY